MLCRHSGWGALVQRGDWQRCDGLAPGREEGPQPRSSGGGCDGTTRPQCRHPSSGSQAESKHAGQSVFRRGLLNRLQQEYQAREQLRARSPRGWVCYVTFICNIFDYLRVRPPRHPVQRPACLRRPLSPCSDPCSLPPTGEQHAHDGPGEPRVRLPLPAGPARQSERGGGGGWPWP